MGQYDLPTGYNTVSWNNASLQTCPNNVTWINPSNGNIMYTVAVRMNFDIFYTTKSNTDCI